jgi:hypothetical protein
MIISHRHRFIFAAIPKTGTHAVRQALRAHLGPDDCEQVALFKESLLPYEELARVGHGHLTLAQVRPHLGDAVFGSYFRFAFVRNPFDRFVSYCAFVSRDSDAFQRDPRAIMRQVLAKPPITHILFAPQHLFVTDADGAFLTDDIGRVESMQASYDRFCGAIDADARARERLAPRRLSRLLRRAAHRRSRADVPARSGSVRIRVLNVGFSTLS